MGSWLAIHQTAPGAAAKRPVIAGHTCGLDGIISQPCKQQQAVGPRLRSIEAGDIACQGLKLSCLGHPHREECDGNLSMRWEIDNPLLLINRNMSFLSGGPCANTLVIITGDENGPLAGTVQRLQVLDMDKDPVCCLVCLLKI